ncbi:MAG: maleylpyruvate isomerase N-terminal domain-containing protein, partial [Dehalococcoidia bacterium]|nr:maleylpyruvate isomerase N-terminal domain-containing protein [Dehalococcoidia bacterium]
MPEYVSARYGDRRRYLVKALREISHRTARLVQGMDEDDLGAPVPDDEWSVAQIVGFLRDSEREDLAALQTMTRVDGDPIQERRAIHGPQERDYGADDVAELLWDFLTLREETVWLLEGAGSAWNYVGIHPFRGEVSVLTWVQEMSERDEGLIRFLMRERHGSPFEHGYFRFLVKA